MSKGGWIQGGDQPALPFSDTETSRDAARSVEKSAPRLRQIVLQTIRDAVDGCTDDEIEIITGLSHQTASARRRELVLSGEIVPNGDRRKTRSGRTAVVHVARD